MASLKISLYGVALRALRERNDTFSYFCQVVLEIGNCGDAKSGRRQKKRVEECNE